MLDNLEGASQKYWYAFSLRKNKETLETIQELLWQKGLSQKVEVLFSSEELAENFSIQLKGGYVFIYCEKITGEFLRFFWSLEGFKGFLLGYNKKGDGSPLHFPSSVTTSSLFKFWEMRNNPSSEIEIEQKKEKKIEITKAIKKPQSKISQFKVNDYITVKDGPLTGNIGIVTGINESKNKLMISTNLFGSSIKVTLNYADCEKNDS